MWLGAVWCASPAHNVQVRLFVTSKFDSTSFSQQTTSFSQQSTLVHTAVVLCTTWCTALAQAMPCLTLWGCSP